MIAERVGAIAEYVMRPLVEDVRVILEKLKELNFPLSERVVKDTVDSCIFGIVIAEFMRMITYITITVIVCVTVFHVLR